MLVGHKPSPYVILKVANTYHKSDIVGHTKAPEWNQFFEFPVYVSSPNPFYNSHSLTC